MRVDTPGCVGRRRAVVDDLERAAKQAAPVERPVGAERLSEPAGTRGEVAIARRLDAPLAHQIEPVERGRGAQQHRVRALPRPAHRVHAPVVAVAEVHVQSARRGEHRRVPGCATPERVAPGIFVGAVRLDFDETRRDAIAHEHLVEQVGRDGECVAIEELPRQRASHVC